MRFRADATLIDLGMHRLRDLADPLRVFQLAHPDLPREFPPLQSLEVFRGNLPVQATSFVGREQELAAIGDALETSRLVTITGVGGVGKTRLAVQAAADVLPRFADGAWICDLATASDAEALDQIVATTLGVSPRAGVANRDAIAEFLQAKDQLARARQLRAPPRRGRGARRHADPAVRRGADARHEPRRSGRRRRTGLAACARSPSARRRNSSSSAPGPSSPTFALEPAARRQWPRSVDGSTACRSRSSSPRLASCR